jgi:hypothetical protein
MKRRDKLVLTGAAALVVGLAAAATLMSEPDEAPRAEAARPEAPVVANKKFRDETLRKLAQVPQADEVPQEFKEAENYLLDRWGHMEDAGLTAPGIMPEGDMFFQDRRLLRGLRGNGTPIYAKAFIRPEVFRAPVAKKGNAFSQAFDRNPSASLPGRTEAEVKANVLDKARRAGSLSEVVGKGRPKTAVGDAPGGGFRKRGEGASGMDGN